ncbi:GNAT family N-acetyltransferase [Salinibacillus xinjiangensis]|uniref:GNAT family N-acetyltransferase n=1 Tax=Salinibacillus xinjiangensis TaxID=1229268 RepID=A0A6G1X8Y6_9BACI|nr:GNAT family N-acetyltransferase [Salinibacillus xinjiangensis]MRG87268.1 GNAT family N-acetyltransferase [Salinibacillus xinjiangensis]
MKYQLKPMSQSDAEIIAEWKYEGPYSFYNPKSDEEDLQLLLSPQTREGVYYSVFDQDESLVGYYSFNDEGKSVEIGLGLRPDLTGQGGGREFVIAGLEYARHKFNPQHFKLAVATFNHRAIKVYERVGFERGQTFLQRTNGGEYEFLSMSMDANKGTYSE